MEREGEPILHDLAASVAEAIPQAIRACQWLINLGYGTPGEPLLGPGQWFPEEMFEGVAEADPGLIASISIPPLRNRTWSILSVVTHGRVGGIARDIVRHGVRASLLQHQPQLHEFTDAYTDQLASAIDDSLSKILEPSGDGRAGPFLDIARTSPVAVAEQVLRQLCRLPKGRAASYTREALARFPAAATKGLVEDSLDEIWKLRDYRFSDFGGFNTEYHKRLQALKVAVGQLLRRDFELPACDPLNGPVVAPIYRLGDDKFFLDRREIEGIRDIRKLIQTHLNAVVDGRADPTELRPLSLAVFGPPGAGKSLAVKNVLKAFTQHAAHPLILDAFNLAQFTGSEPLDHAFGQITDTCAQNKVPVAFFDEFDSQYQGNDLGWLKFFLSPMEDGVYKGRPVHTAVFIFAGGTSPTYSDFSLETRPNTDPQVQAFGKAKGPDFTSRLKGHMDVVGVNPADSDDTLYLIRRAVVVRSILAGVQHLKDETEAAIDDDILRAILFVPHYRNGARSIRKLVEMCPGSDKRLTNSSLPPINQLNMVTDGKAFLDLLYDVSAERDPDRR